MTLPLMVNRTFVLGLLLFWENSGPILAAGAQSAEHYLYNERNAGNGIPRSFKWNWLLRAPAPLSYDWLTQCQGNINGGVSCLGHDVRQLCEGDTV